MELKANTREVFGKKVRFLRRQGITPAHLFGHSIEPVPLQCDTADLKQALIDAGTGLIDLKLDKAKKARPVMPREIQRDPMTGELVHVDFYQVRMEEKIRLDVPIVTIGEAPALKMKENFIVHEMDTLSIECLPNEIPAHIELDISGLEEADQALHVSDIHLGENITIITPEDHLILKISSGYVAEEEAAAPEEGLELEEVSATLPEGEQPAEESKEE